MPRSIRTRRVALLLLSTVFAAAAAAQRPAVVGVVVASRTISDGTRSWLVEITSVGEATIDGLRIELASGDAARSTVVVVAPAGWRVERDGRAVRLAGSAAPLPQRFRLTSFDQRALPRTRVQVRRDGRNLWDQDVDVAALRAVDVAARTAGFLQMPTVVSPGDTVEMQLLDPKTTPTVGQWVVGGVLAAAVGDDRIRVTLPDDLVPGMPVRVSYFDVWGQRIVDALTVDDMIVEAPRAAGASAPRITGCARYGLSGESLCVCGDFPEGARQALTIDGQPATALAASRHVVHLRLPASIAPGPHLIGGSTAAGFAPDNTVTARVVEMRASIDANALLRGQSTTLRVALTGAIEPLTMAIMNRTPATIALAGGNYQEVTPPLDGVTPAELRVNARAAGNFSIDTLFTVPPCPCAEVRDDLPSAVSQPTPVFVPRRVLATIAAGTPAAMTATAQTVAAANGLAVVDVVALALTAEGLATFEIVDGVAVPAKVAALAADPNVTATQPDFVYDTFQGTPASAGPLVYGPTMIGAEAVRSLNRGDGVRIGVVDAGIDAAHPRLAAQLAELVDVTGTGMTPDVHGTLVAGVIVAQEGAGLAPTGVAPGATLVGVKACVPIARTRAAARCFSSTLARGIDAASARNVRVMNVSVGGPDDRLLTRLVDAAAAKGIAVVSAAGNDGPSGKPSFPAVMENAIAVTAVDAAGGLYTRATRGRFIDFAAPGVDILSTAPGGKDQLFSGTSAATAFTSGAIALLLQRSGTSLADVRTLLGTTARDLGSAGPDAEFGAGLINVCAAIAQATRRQIACAR